MADRGAELLGQIDRTSKILEVGPSSFPITPRSAGWNVTIVDHATQDELIEKYRSDPNANIANIEKVDYVWRGGMLHEAVPDDQHGTFDVLIASHVIEHLPDPIGFLDSASRLLHPVHGMIALAVPDKRWCFDCLRQISTTGQILAAHKLRRERHDLAARFDFSAYFAFDGERTGWDRERLPELRLGSTLEHAYREFLSWSDEPGAPYVDIHAWYFTPASFELLILELGSVGLIDWRISWLQPRPGVEFFVRLARGRIEFTTPEARDTRRVELLKGILFDIREQPDRLVTPECDRPEPTVSASAPEPTIVTLDAGTRLQLQQIAATCAMLSTALRPARAVWHRMLPFRRVVAHLRRRG